MSRDLRIPVLLDEPKKAFLWDFDVFLMFIVGLFIGLMIRQIFVTTILFTFLAWRWGKFKSGKHQWFFMYAMYWYLPMSDSSTRVPATKQREFLR